MSKDFYENIIATASNLDELRIIHKFLVCDLHIMGGEYRYIASVIAKREADILLSMQQSFEVK